MEQADQTGRQGHGATEKGEGLTGLVITASQRGTTDQAWTIKNGLVVDTRSHSRKHYISRPRAIIGRVV